MRCPKTRSTTCRPSGRSAPTSTTPSTRRCTRARSRIRTASGASRPSASTGSSPTRRSRTPPTTRTTSRSSGSRTARSTSAPTASTAISRSAATRSPSSGKATIPTIHKTSPTGSCTPRCCRFANVLKKHGVKKGDRVTIYLPMISEAAYAMLACARIGAVHSVVFGGFSPGFARRPHRGLQVRHHHHRRRGRARRPQDSAQGQRRRRLREGTGVKTVIVVRHTGAGHHEGRPRRLLRRRSPRSSADCPPRR